MPWAGNSPLTAEPSVDADRPVLVLRVVAPNRAEVDLLELLGELAHAPAADLAVVDLDYRGDLGAGAAEEELLTGVELRAVDAALDYGQAQLVANHLDQQVAGDALEDVVGDRWGGEDAVFEHEEVLGRALGDVAVVREHDRLVESVLQRL